MLKRIALMLLPVASALFVCAQQRVPALVELSPSPLLFGNVGVATATTQAITVTNAGPTTLTIASGYPIILGNDANDFGVTGNDCGSAVPAGHRCTIKITFTPGVRGSRSAFLKFVDDGNASPRIVTLAGAGQ
jgi:hypothetical protein